MGNLDSRLKGNKQLLCDIAKTLEGMGCGIAITLSGQRIERPLNSNSMGILAYFK
tara:strand:- start:1815 stop:1979 length:165 start_codon:yes stop_codon:yes gene_type:complete